MAYFVPSKMENTMNCCLAAYRFKKAPSGRELTPKAAEGAVGVEM